MVGERKRFPSHSWALRPKYCSTHQAAAFVFMVRDLRFHPNVVLEMVRTHQGVALERFDDKA